MNDSTGLANQRIIGKCPDPYCHEGTVVNAGVEEYCDVCDGKGNIWGDPANDTTGLPKYATAANDNGHSMHGRDAPRDIAALARSGHVEVGGALPISQRVQTSGRGDPPAPRWSAEGERAQRILGRGYAQGGEARVYALTLWLLHGQGEHPADALELGCVLLLDEPSRLGLATEWGTQSERALVLSGVEIIGRATGWYEDASDEPGCAGHLGELVAAADALHGSGGAWQRMRNAIESERAKAKAAKKGKAA